MVSLSLLTLTLVPLAVWAQTVVNGQIFTNGLSIIDVRATSVREDRV
jgi:hypothetical protein